MIVDGKQIAQDIQGNLLQAIASDRLRLAIVQVGDDAASTKFVAMKKKFGEGAGVETRVYSLPATISTTELRKKVAEVSHLTANDGVIIQLPLPAQVNTQYILDGIPPHKDVDVLSAKAFGKFAVGRGVLSPVVGAMKEIFDRHDVVVRGKNAVVLGAGKLVGLPVALWLIREGATVTVVNEFTEDTKRHTILANIIVSGVGRSGVLTADMVREGVILIDAGTSEADGKLVGDISPDIAGKAALYTPVPGGVGPITVAKVFENLLLLNK